MNGDALNQDEMIVQYRTEASGGLDPFDSQKIFGSEVAISSIATDGKNVPIFNQLNWGRQPGFLILKLPAIGCLLCKNKIEQHHQSGEMCETVNNKYFFYCSTSLFVLNGQVKCWQYSP